MEQDTGTKMTKAQIKKLFAEAKELMAKVNKEEAIDLVRRRNTVLKKTTDRTDSPPREGNYEKVQVRKRKRVEKPKKRKKIRRPPKPSPLAIPKKGQLEKDVINKVNEYESQLKEYYNDTKFVQKPLTLMMEKIRKNIIMFAKDEEKKDPVEIVYRKKRDTTAEIKLMQIMTERIEEVKCSIKIPSHEELLKKIKEKSDKEQNNNEVVPECENVKKLKQRLEALKKQQQQHHVVLGLEIKNGKVKLKKINMKKKIQLKPFTLDDYKFPTHLEIFKSGYLDVNVQKRRMKKASIIRGI